MLNIMNRCRLAPLAAAPLLALAACSGGNEDSAGGEAPSSAESGEQAASGTIEATIDGKTYNFAVGEGGESGIKVTDNDPITVTSISGEGDNELRILLIAQRGVGNFDSISINDGPVMNPLESQEGTAKIEFDSQGDGGVYSGSFSATLERVDAQTMPDDMETMFDAPVEISGTFNAEAE